MCSFSVKVLMVVGMVVFISTSLMAADGLMDLRLSHNKVDDRINTPRLALGTLKEKDKEKELQVDLKRRAAKKPTVRRVSREDKQRKKKTKRVVASQ